MYTVTGRGAATAATADHAIFQVWNPHATQIVKLICWSLFKSAAGAGGDSLRFRRSTVRGTAGSTVTPDIDNHSRRGIAPPSGLLLDFAAFTTQPTLDGSDFNLGWIAAAFAAAGGIFSIPGGIEIPPSSGIVAIQRAATAWPISDVSAGWLEDW